MCLTRVLVPHRLPHRIGRGTAGFRGGLHVESGAVRSAGSAAPCPWTLRRVTSTPAVVTAGARRRNAALAPVYQLPVTQRINQTVEQ